MTENPKLRFDKVLLVRGTWAKKGNSDWTSGAHELSRALYKAGLSNIESPDTYFGNSARGRYTAARCIKDWINIQDQSLRLLIIAHSHAGNAAIKAISMAEMRNHQIGLVTLSTPFIQICRIKNKLAQGEIIIGVALVLITISMFLAPKWVSFSQFNIGALILFMMIALLVKFLIHPGASISGSIPPRISDAMNAINYPLLDKDKVKSLVIRGVGDEAAAAISLGSIAAAIIRWVTIGYDKYSRHIKIVSALIGIVLAYMEWKKQEKYDLFVIMLVSAPVYAIFIAAIVYSLSRFVGIFQILSNGSFGFDLMLNLYGCEFDVSTAPNGSGTEVITLIPIDDAVKYDNLRHSIYDHPDCASTIVSWACSNASE